MLAVWCFTVFAAVGERLAVSGKRERGERGGWIKSGSTLLVSFTSTFISLCTSTSLTPVLALISS